MFFVGLLLSCKKDSSTEPPEQDTGKIIFEFANYVDGLPLQTDTLMYINQAGNHYMVTEVKYFISDVTLHKSDGTQTVINKWKDIFYVDNTIPSPLPGRYMMIFPREIMILLVLLLESMKKRIKHSYLLIHPK